ncbi:type II CAAX endopeptidase family protein [Acaryochloris sp. IP29b_bin.148]|uniref:CPBP family intramembrane glutamic endopeptidase n=1 Tax=Acaryochloris sp. IP29b_bin.148 TaxID=2969218 RepID=UPI00260E30E5|nr:type II CAAX endopeptidase family protein [Acaryochloris sp. IP29b_bin.148]
MSSWPRKIFISRRSPRLRAGWRILSQNVFELAFYVFLSFIFFRNISSTNQQAVVFDQALVFDRLIFLAATTLSIFLARRYLDRRPFDSLGLEINPWMLWDLLFGFVLAGLLMAGIYGFEFQAGWLQFTGYRWQQDSIETIVSETFTGFLVLGICPAWHEELTYRGYWLQNIKEGLNLAWAITLTSMIFAVRHLSNPAANALSTLVVCLVGLWLAYAWFITRQLWLPLGIHVGWNFFEGIVFGFPVGGQSSYHWIEQTVIGPAWITGGIFGPEAGLVGVVAITLGILFVFGWSRWRLLWTKPSPT